MDLVFQIIDGAIYLVSCFQIKTQQIRQRMVATASGICKLHFALDLGSSAAAGRLDNYRLHVRIMHFLSRI